MIAPASMVGGIFSISRCVERPIGCRVERFPQKARVVALEIEPHRITHDIDNWTTFLLGQRFQLFHEVVWNDDCRCTHLDCFSSQRRWREIGQRMLVPTRTRVDANYGTI